MLPVLFSVGSISISSFGFFLSLAFLYGTFLIWRLARAWDLNEEKILDLILLTFFGGLLGSRIFFVILNFEFFASDFFRAILITKYPGLNFWGGLLGGWLTLHFFARRLKLDFWMVADLAAIGLLGGLIFGNIGCFLGGCGVGIPSDVFFATNVVGIIGKRFPIALIEAIIVAVLLSRIWAQAKRFHFPAKIASLTLIYLGIVKFFTEFFRDVQQSGHFLSFSIFILGILIFYKVGRRSIKNDLRVFTKTLVGIISDRTIRRRIYEGLLKSWYNKKITWSWRINSLKRNLRRSRVKPTPKDI